MENNVDLPNPDLKKFDPKNLYKNKLLLLFIGSAGFIIILLVIANFLRDKNEVSAEIPVTDKIEVKTASEAINIDKVWRNKLEENIESQDKNFKETIAQLTTEISKSASNQETRYIQEIESLKEQIKFLGEELKESKNLTDPLKIAQSNSVVPKVSKFNLNLNNPLNADNYEPIKTSDNYIPANTFVKAVLLSGVDVSTAVKSSSNPDPIIIRLTDHGTLPRQFKSDLKNCHVLGAVHGDLSSERAKVRLEKLSCVEIKTGEVIETEVAGFVTGEDGRQGIRGTVVSVDSKFLKNSFIGGVIGGFAKSGTKSTEVYNPFTIGMGKVNAPGMKDRIQDNILDGAGSSLDRLSDYYIDMAESVQPVIQIAAGRKIDVVFTEGVFFGTSVVKQQVSKKRDEAIKNTADQESNQFIQKLN